MKYKQLFLRGICVTLVGASSVQSAWAHHSFATHYDSQNVIEISGTLSAVKMRSPHSFFEVDVITADGSTDA